MPPHPQETGGSETASENCSGFGHKEEGRRGIGMRMEVSTDEVETTFRVFCGQMGRLVTSPFFPAPSSSNSLNETLSSKSYSLWQDNDYCKTHVGGKKVI